MKIKFILLIFNRLEFNGLFAQIVCKNNLTNGCTIIVESTTSTLHLIEQLKIRGLNIIPYQPKESKETRAHNASLDIASGKVLLPQKATWIEDFKHEVIAFPNGRHDDQVDALTQLILRSAYKSAQEKQIEAIKLLTEDSKSDEARARKLYRMRYGKSLGY